MTINPIYIAVKILLVRKRSLKQELSLLEKLEADFLEGKINEVEIEQYYRSISSDTQNASQGNKS